MRTPELKPKKNEFGRESLWVESQPVTQAGRDTGIHANRNWRCRLVPAHTHSPASDSEWAARSLDDESRHLRHENARALREPGISRRTPAGFLATAIIIMILATSCVPAGFSSGASGDVLPPLTETWAFATPHSARSDSAVQMHAPQLAMIVTAWTTLDSATGQPSSLLEAGAQPPTSVQRAAVISTFSRDAYRPEPVRLLARDSNALARAAQASARLLSSAGIGTAILDFDGQSRADLPAVVRVLHAFSDSLARAGVVPVIALPAADTAAYPTQPFLFANTILLKFYDPGRLTAEPRPVLTRESLRRVLGARVSVAGATRFVAALPVYGNVWRPGGAPEIIGFADARRLAAEANVAMERDPANGSLHAVRPGAWELWLPDSAVVRDLVRDVRSLGVQRVALWRLGYEDPAVWSSVRRSADPSDIPRE
jgi:spore germination protein YaaH